MATIHQSIGDLGQARENTLRAKKIREATLPKDHPDLAVTLNNLASIYQASGDYVRAEESYLRSLRRARFLPPFDLRTISDQRDLDALFADLAAKRWSGRLVVANALYARFHTTFAASDFVDRLIPV